MGDRNASSSAATVITTLSGESATLPCVIVDGGNYADDGKFFLKWMTLRGGLVYSWFSGSGSESGDPAAAFQGRLKHGLNESLIFLAVNPSDAGVYQCQVNSFTRPAGKLMGQAVQLIVHTLPEFSRFSPEHVVFRQDGGHLLLPCEASGIPPPTISWTKGGERLGNDTRRTVTSTQLYINKLLPGDEGPYTCVASNSVGTRTKSIELRFGRMPEIVQPPENRTAFEGGDVRWPCHASALPDDLSYRWYAGDREIMYANALGLRSTVEKDGHLTISRVSADDSGPFRCAACNTYGCVKSPEAFLDVFYAPRILSSTRVIQYLPEGLDGHLQCHVTAHPAVTHVVWTKDQHAISLPDPLGRKFVDEQIGRLNFVRVNADDRGLYTCQARNVAGLSPVFEIHVFVQKPPRFLVSPPDEMRRREGDSMLLNCEGEGQPERVEVYWQKNGARLQMDDRISVTGQATLTIKQLRWTDSGVYECVVENVVARLTRKTVLTMEDTPPQAPVNVMAEPGAFDVSLAWGEGYDGGHTQQFVIRYHAVDQATAMQWHVMNVSTATRVKVARLAPSTTYEFEIEPKNSRGVGRKTVLSARTLGIDAVGADYPVDETGATYRPLIGTPALPRPPAPSDFYVDSENRNVVFSWSDHSEHVKPPVLYYAIEYRTAERQPIVETRRKRRAVDADNQFSVLAEKRRDPKLQYTHQIGRELSPGTTYEFRVRSYSLVSFSEPSNSVRHTVSGVTPKMAMIGAVLGGVLFFLICMVLAVVAVRMARRRRQNRKYHHASGGMQQTYSYMNGSNGKQNGHGNGHFGGDVDYRTYKASGPDDKQPPILSSSEQQRVSSIRAQLLPRWLAFSHITTQPLDKCCNTAVKSDGVPLPCSPPRPTLTRVIAQQESAVYDHLNGCRTYCEPSYGLPTATSSSLHSAPRKDSESRILSISTLLRRFQTDSWNRQAKALDASPDMLGARDAVQVADVTPIGHTGYLFRVQRHKRSPLKPSTRTAYSRHRLLTTIDRLRRGLWPMSGEVQSKGERHVSFSDNQSVHMVTPRASIVPPQLMEQECPDTATSSQSFDSSSTSSTSGVGSYGAVPLASPQWVYVPPRPMLAEIDSSSSSGVVSHSPADSLASSSSQGEYNASEWTHHADIGIRTRHVCVGPYRLRTDVMQSEVL